MTQEFEKKLTAKDFRPKPPKKPTKLSKSFSKKINEFIETLSKLKCQRYTSGKCADFTPSSTEAYQIKDFCPVCQIREGSKLIKNGVEKFNPNRKVY